MPKPLLLIFLLFTTVVFSQERKNIFGTITGVGSLENLHVLNKNTDKGTITDAAGRFQISVRVKDTLIISGVQFYYQEVLITDSHIDNNTLNIDLLQRINELDEVTVKSHNLSGNLQTDAQKIKDSLAKVKEGILDFSAIDFSLEHMGPKDVVDRMTPPNPLGPSNGVPGFAPGADILGLVLFLLEPLTKPIRKIGETKRKNNKRNKSVQRSLAIAPDLILNEYRKLLQDELKIPADQVEAFIQFCGTKGLYHLFLEDKKIEMIDLFLKEKDSYLQKQ